jgi:NADH dehydrogenase
VTPGDVTNREFVENAAQSTEAIVHLAGIIREFPARGVTFEKVHGEATQHAVHAAKRWGISRFVHVSALGASPRGPGKYFTSKGKAEEIVRQSGLSWTIFRPSGIVGPGDQFLNELGLAVRRAPFLPIPGDGEFLLQPVFVGDVVKGIADCLKRPDTEKRVFEVGGPERITYNALIDRIAAVQGVRVRKVHIPLPRFRRIVGFFSRFEKFPLTPDMLEVLLAGNTCERDPFFSTFGIDPLHAGDARFRRGRYPVGGYRQKPWKKRGRFVIPKDCLTSFSLSTSPVGGCSESPLWENFFLFGRGKGEKLSYYSPEISVY